VFQTRLLFHNIYVYMLSYTEVRKSAFLKTISSVFNVQTLNLIFTCIPKIKTNDCVKRWHCFEKPINLIRQAIRPSEMLAIVTDYGVTTRKATIDIAQIVLTESCGRTVHCGSCNCSLTILGPYKDFLEYRNGH
jgi:hypothetical protein